MEKSGTIESLRDTYNMGRINKIKTIGSYDIEGSETMPVEVTILNTKGQSLGWYYLADVDKIINEGLTHGDNKWSNPNLPMLRSIFNDMLDIREKLGQAPYESKKKPDIPAHISKLIGLETLG